MLKQPVLNWINGEWIDSGIHKDSINPATYDVIGQYADATYDDAVNAIAAAKYAFKNTAWKDDRLLRAKALHEMADLFDHYYDDLVHILSTENGKVKAEAELEIGMVANKLRYSASLVRTEYGRSLEPKAGSFSIVLREPMGVAGIIAPWNSPVVLMIRSLAPALAAGTTTVVKLPSQTSQVNAFLSKIFSEVKSLPKGVINVLTESGAEVSKLLIESVDVPVISFTGSSATGQAISKVGAQNLKRFGLELGGKTPMIVFNDANLEEALPKLEKSLTVFAGQFCMTGSRLLVQRGIAEELKKRLAERLSNVKVGPATDLSSDMGPLIDKPNVERVNAIVEKAISEGAKVIVRGGPVVDGPLSKGAFYRPSLLEVTDPNMDIVQKEVFGPVLTMLVFDTEAEAVELANNSEYGLAASIWTQDVNRPLRVARDISAGTIWINDWAVIYDEFEEGGYKQSGLGRMNGVAAMDDFIEYKHITITTGTI